MKVLLGLLVLCACSEPRHRRFPIGIYDVDDPKQLAELKEMGFDSFETGSDEPAKLEPLAREARRLQMRLFAFPWGMIEKGVPPPKDWPLEAWYLEDEPDVHKTSAAKLEEKSKKVRSWHPEATQAFVIGQGSAAATYDHIADVLLLDWYPVPHLALDSVADHIDLARKYMPAGKPLWMIVQAFDWRDARQRDPKKKRIGRFPTFHEIRFMTYLSLAHGADGVYYYTLKKPGGRTLFDVPEELDSLARVVRELRWLQPVFERGLPAPLPFAPPLSIEARAWTHRGRRYIILVNRSLSQSATVPSELLHRSWRPLFESRRNVAELLVQRRTGYSLRPTQVLVMEGSAKD